MKICTPSIYSLSERARVSSLNSLMLFVLQEYARLLQIPSWKIFLEAPFFSFSIATLFFFAISIVSTYKKTRTRRTMFPRISMGRSHYNSIQVVRCGSQTSHTTYVVPIWVRIGSYSVDKRMFKRFWCHCVGLHLRMFSSGPSTLVQGLRPWQLWVGAKELSSSL